jgi:hypothetical protein
LQESTATLSLSETLKNLREIHEKQINETKINERVRMLESVKTLYNDGKIDQEVLELLALEIAMGE